MQTFTSTTRADLSETGRFIFIKPSILKYLIAAVIYTLFSAVVMAQSGANTTTYFQENGIAIKGYDPVAYFSDKKAVAGNSSIVIDWSGTTWQFISTENRELFKKNPEKYAPQYGGFCAYGVSENHKSPTDPNAWTIVGDKLYLNYSPKVKELWTKDIPGRIQKADSHWKKLEKESN